MVLRGTWWRQTPFLTKSSTSASKLTNLGDDGGVDDDGNHDWLCVRHYQFLRIFFFLFYFSFIILCRVSVGSVRRRRRWSATPVGHKFTIRPTRLSSLFADGPKEKRKKKMWKSSFLIQVRELLSSATVQGAPAVYASHIDGTLSSNSIRRKRRVTFEYVALLSPRIIQLTNHLVMRFQWD